MFTLDWQRDFAKNNEMTLSLNGTQLYSKYKPKEGALNWIQSEIDLDAEKYVLIGLGLGYHLEHLLNLVGDKKVYVYYFDEVELSIFLEIQCKNVFRYENVELRNEIKDLTLNEKMQILIPNAWIKGIGEKHPLFKALNVIKINQLSYRLTKEKMIENFNSNILSNSDVISNINPKRIGCLVAAGPSLDETVVWLKENQDFVDIFVVGAALKTVSKNKIIPTGVVISDASDLIKRQFDGLKYDGPLYHLCTANSETIKLMSGKKHILFQKGFSFAEEAAKKNGSPLIDVGGSVGTVTFSLLEQLGYQTIVLFGQDLGFPNDRTHSENSTSNTNVKLKDIKRKLKANDGSMINTNSMLYSFWNWYEEKCQSINIDVLNTASKGAKISNVKLINKMEFEQLIQKNINQIGD
ncbi:motility associated factor glycosyltransferase family protein [Solibacillus faecavium]|uniref:motility associated factor glycosyltransferase family protein n=1 Tax=Solibacillus faecavium TaxID=2762221 RepID=UPI00296B0182|nr:6-hydroxymethylpterin diphosphokinase MptE-like protein [Solibacillus faecavium]